MLKEINRDEVPARLLGWNSILLQDKKGWAGRGGFYRIAMRSRSVGRKLFDCPLNPDADSAGTPKSIDRIL